MCADSYDGNACGIIAGLSLSIKSANGSTLACNELPSLAMQLHQRKMAWASIMHTVPLAPIVDCQIAVAYQDLER